MTHFSRSLLVAAAATVIALASGCATTAQPSRVTTWLIDFPVVSGEGAGYRWFTTSLTVTERADGTGVVNMQVSSVVADPCWAGTTDVQVARDGKLLVVTQPGKMSSCRTIRYQLPLEAGATGAAFVRPGLSPNAPFAQEPTIRNFRRT